MKIVEVSTGIEFEIQILPIKNTDFKLLGKERYFFNWRNERNYEIYKLQKVNSSDILGLISIEPIPNEWRIHIRLLTVSKENKGNQKKYDKIAGNLMAHVAKIAVAEFGELACVSLKPKTKIAKHYINKYNMNLTGATISIEVPEILDLINLYDYD